MNKYIVLYHAASGAMEKMAAASPEEMKKEMGNWMAWANRSGAGLIDMGAPLGGARTVTSANVSSSKSSVVGYSILQAENMDEAVALLKDHPHNMMDGSCSIEVHQVMPLPGM